MVNSKVETINDEMSNKIIETAEKIAATDGVDAITVRKILLNLKITNRVFYNRFHNIDEVLEIVYNSTMLQIRESITSKFNPDKDFFEQATDIAVNALIMTYDNKMKIGYFTFGGYSLYYDNYNWWSYEIKKLLNFAIERNLIKNIDTEVISYSIWTFCRGYNADAIGRKIPKETAIENFKCGFGLFLEGLRNVSNK